MDDRKDEVKEERGTEAKQERRREERNEEECGARLDHEAVRSERGELIWHFWGGARGDGMLLHELPARHHDLARPHPNALHLAPIRQNRLAQGLSKLKIR